MNPEHQKFEKAPWKRLTDRFPSSIFNISRANMRVGLSAEEISLIETLSETTPAKVAQLFERLWLWKVQIQSFSDWHKEVTVEGKKRDLVDFILENWKKISQPIVVWWDFASLSLKPATLERFGPVEMTQSLFSSRVWDVLKLDARWLVQWTLTVSTKF